MVRVALATLAVAVSAWLALEVIGLPGLGLERQVDAELMDSGVENAVTAVLLNFRALDTLYEVSVLALAAVVTLSLKPTDALAESPPPAPLLEWLVPRLVPVVVLYAGYLWWAGSTRPGGAFQAGTTVAAMLLLLALSRRHENFHDWGPRAIAMAGPLAFLLVGSITALAGSAFLEYPPSWDKAVIVSIEAVLTAAIGVTLAVLAAGGRQEP